MAINQPTTETHQWAIGDLIYIEHMPPPPLQIFYISDYALVYKVDMRSTTDEEMRLHMITKDGRVLATSLQSPSVAFIRRTDLQYDNEDPSQVMDDHKQGVFRNYFTDLPDVSALAK